MEEPKYAKNFSLENFAYIYVSEALRLTRNAPTADRFYNSLFDTLSERSGLSKEAILKIHHPFHWTFFDNKDSILEYIQTNTDGNRIRLKRTYFLADIQTIADKVLKDYGKCLREKIKSPEQVLEERKKYYQERIHNLIQ